MSKGPGRTLRQARVASPSALAPLEDVATSDVVGHDRGEVLHLEFPERLGPKFRVPHSWEDRSTFDASTNAAQSSRLRGTQASL